MLNIVFMGTPDFARDSLKVLHQAKHNILAVVTAPDKPKGRGMKLLPSPVKEYAIENNFKLYQPEKVRGNEEFIQEVKEMNPDVICVVAYGKILPKELLEIPKLGCINVHPSMLPKYRGPAPIQWAVLNGDTKTGVTTMYMDEELDSGDIILQEEIEISETQTTGEIWDILSQKGAKLLEKTLELVENKTAPRIKQGNDFTIAPMLEKSNSKIDWENETAVQIKNLVRGLNPIMGAYALLNGKKIKFWNVECISIEEFINKYSDFKAYKQRLEYEVTSGAVVYVDSKEAIYIKAKDGIIKVNEIQGENAKRMSTPDFLRGNKIETADIFE